MKTSVFANYSKLIALPHSIFALPFALSSLLLALKAGVTAQQKFSLALVVIIAVLTVVAARTAALAFNRLVDAKIDAENPRTKMREIPRQAISKAAALILAVSASGVYFFLCAQLGKHCLVLSPLVLVVLLGYSFAKRFTAYSHVILGLALALAPGGAWWILRPEVELTPLLLMAGVLFWVAGFDIIYSCQDEAFDRAQGLFSLPARLGTKGALSAARGAHIVSFLLFLLLGANAGMGWAYFIGLVLIGALFLHQHSLVSEDDLSRVDQAFFTNNGLISLLFLGLVLLSK